MASIAIGRSFLSPCCSTTSRNTRFILTPPSSNTLFSKRLAFHSIQLRASSGPNPTDPDPKSSALQDDVNYIFQLAAGSFLGAALIKYGSVLLPEITRPNIVQALLMILTPVLIAVFLMSNGSRKE